MSDTLFLQIKDDYLTAYEWAAKKAGKPGKRIWKSKDNKALGLLIKYMREYYKPSELNSDQMHKACRVWLNKAFTTAPEWLRNDGELTVMVSRFEVIMESPDPKSQAAIIAKIKKDKYKTGYYDPAKHELINKPFTKSQPDQLSNILKTIAGTNPE